MLMIFLFFSNSHVETESLKSALSNNFKLKDLGDAKECLGMRIIRDKEKGIITLDQTEYINKILKRFNMSTCKSMSTPLETNLDFGLQVEMSNKDIPYQQAIGSLMYLAVLTRPDISYTVSFMSQFNNKYTENHWKCIKRIFKYLQGTKNFGLVFKKSNNCNIEGFVDADWAGDKRDRKSYTGYVFKLSENAISWESRKQRTVALSSTEAEYMAISEAAKEAIYLKNLLCELMGKSSSSSVKLYNDNLSAQKLALNPMYHKRLKHIDIRHHFIREAVLNKNIELAYVPTDEMTADIMTKSLGVCKHNKFVSNMGIHETCKF